MNPPKYPEHEKLSDVAELSHELGGFIDWLGGNSYLIAEWAESEFRGGAPSLSPVHKTINQWLAEFYDIDLVKLEEEKQQMLDEIRA